MYEEARVRLVEWLERQLVGPARSTEDECEIHMSPLDRYPVGVLHPLESEEPGVDPASQAGAGEDGPGDLFLDEDQDEAPRAGEPEESGQKAAPVRRRRYVPPSSVGFSFCVRGNVRLRIEASAAVYVQPKEGPSDSVARDERGRFVGPYSRKVLPPAHVSHGGADGRHRIWGGRAGIDVRARPHGGGTILTVTLFNRQKVDWRKRARRRQVARVERSLFEARLECFVEEGELVDYPRVDPSLLTDEEHELELQYRERRIFAVGHGAAADWMASAEERARPDCIRSEFLPRVETPIVSVRARGDAEVLELERLASEDLPLDRLRAFVGEYGAWWEERLVEASGLLEETDQDAALRICERMDEAHGRMLRGVAMLAGDDDAALAFRLANRSMLRQMVNLHGERDEPWAWRPFQLGFLLVTIESTVSERDKYRDVLDLIWFQTGGGKTEAYLGLIVFLLVWRRLRYGEQGGGTAAFMRYTLRLLTKQQFERAAGLICALELLRREGEAEGRLGAEPFTVGIWVGSGVCPNTIRDAAAIVSGLVNGMRTGAGDDRDRNSLLLYRCPWCHEPFDAERGYEAVRPDFRFRCTNPACEFGQSDHPLPCRVVDESLYAHPPSLLIGTIDKFARLAWEERSGAFFGAGGNRRAPDLILQDELHLIAGPLGSVAGLYEAGIETAIRCRGVKPKYIASTATIRMAKEQVQALYGRGVAVFPPPGLSCDDSWFAQVDRSRPGRLYVGYLAPLKDQRHCLAPLAASLVAGPLVVFREDVDKEDLFEAWWTNVLYHGSLRGVGMSANVFESDVREFGERLIAEYVEERRGAESWPRVRGQRQRQHRPRGPGRTEEDPIEKELRGRFREPRVEQLWSRHTSEQIADTFERLGEPRGSERCLDAVLSTNMVSVGLDVSRLALMVVNGQPLTTGEYVQATSRVGRDEVPGVVVANYYRHQARSLSHYESFRPYHESFYRFVEPSSVTPYTFQVRKRALHAALVIALRHACDGLASNKAAGNFERQCPEVSRVVTELRRRVQRACPEKAAEVERHIDHLVEEWHREVEICRGCARGLHYRARDNAYSCLLHGHEDGPGSPGLWVTLHSMRNVESPAVLGMR